MYSSGNYYFLTVLLEVSMMNNKVTQTEKGIQDHDAFVSTVKTSLSTAKKQDGQYP